jgi:hypothetical protein
VTGNCTTVGYCVQSPNYPKPYGNDQSCTIEIKKDLRARLTGMLFNTEKGADKLTINGEAFSGSDGPKGVIPTGDITWASDSENDANGHWQLCLQERPIILTLTTTPKPAVYTGCPVNVFAQFFPANSEMLKDRTHQKFFNKGEEPFDSFAQVDGPKDGSVFLEVLVTEKPHTGVEELPAAMEVIRRVQGDLFVALKNSLRRFVDFKPIVGGMYVNWVKLRPFSGDKCEAKMDRLVHDFSVSYTRRLVPWALYNECTNYMTAMSFSHDEVVDKLDRAKCRAWTHTFMEKWNYGMGVKEVVPNNLFDCKAGHARRHRGWSDAKKCWCCHHQNVFCDHGATCPEPEVNRTKHVDYKCWCRGVCESKYGVGAPICHISDGAKLYHQPV